MLPRSGGTSRAPAVGEEVQAVPRWNPQSVYSPLSVPYAVLPTKQSVQVPCKSLRVRVKGFSNPPFRTNLTALPAPTVPATAIQQSVYPRTGETRVHFQ